MKELLFIWIVTVSGLPSMNTHHGFENYQECNNEIMRLEREYYRDRLPHKRAKNGESYHMECLTNKEVTNRLFDTQRDLF